MPPAFNMYNCSPAWQDQCVLGTATPAFVRTIQFVDVQTGVIHLCGTDRVNILS